MADLSALAAKSATTKAIETPQKLKILQLLQLLQRLIYHNYNILREQMRKAANTATAKWLLAPYEDGFMSEKSSVSALSVEPHDSPHQHVRRLTPLIAVVTGREQTQAKLAAISAMAKGL